MKRIAAAGLASVLLVSCSQPVEPKAECARYRTEVRHAERLIPDEKPLGQTFVEELGWYRFWERTNIPYAAELKRIRRKYQRRLDTVNVRSFCGNY